MGCVHYKYKYHSFRGTIQPHNTALNIQTLKGTSHPLRVKGNPTVPHMRLSRRVALLMRSSCTFVWISATLGLYDVECGTMFDPHSDPWKRMKVLADSVNKQRRAGPFTHDQV